MNRTVERRDFFTPETFRDLSEEEELVLPSHPPDLLFSSPATAEAANYAAFVYFRPWISDFLRMLSLHYEIVCFTAALRSYGNISWWFSGGRGGLGWLAGWAGLLFVVGNSKKLCGKETIVENL